MFLPFDIPLIGKKAIHRRSKTVCVIDHKQKNDQFCNESPSFKSQRSLSKSSLKFKHIHSLKPDQKQNQQFTSMKKMTQKIQQLINKELQYPQFISSINTNLKTKLKHNSLENNNPETKNEFSDDFDNKKTKFLNDSGFPENQYLTLLKKTKKLHSKSFIPHFNWKQKLTRLKNMGNYGHVFKKKTDKIPERTITFIKPQEQKKSQNYAQIKKISQNKSTFLQNLHDLKNLKRTKRCYTINEKVLQQKQKSFKRQNKTCLIGQKLYQQNIVSQKKVKKLVNAHSYSKKGHSSERQWNFGPWDDLKVQNL